MQKRQHLEVERDERENKALEILHKVVEDPQPLGILASLHIKERADLRSLQSRCVFVFVVVVIFKSQGLVFGRKR